MNNYEILGIAVDSDEKAIKSAYRKLVVKYHPDKTNNNASLTQEFLKVQKAYDELLKGITGVQSYQSTSGRRTGYSYGYGGPSQAEFEKAMREMEEELDKMFNQRKRHQYNPFDSFRNPSQKTYERPKQDWFSQETYSSSFNIEKNGDATFECKIQNIVELKILNLYGEAQKVCRIKNLNKHTARFTLTKAELKDLKYVFILKYVGKSGHSAEETIIIPKPKGWFSFL
jgi:hypothetical protein